MKISLALSLFILAAAGSFLWLRSQRLAVVRENYTHLVAEAATFGITLDPSRPHDPIRPARRERENRGVDAKATATDLIALAKDMELSGDLRGLQNEAQQTRMTEIMSRMISLDTAQLKTLITEVRAANDLKAETREYFTELSLRTLASDHPQVALAFLTESPDLLKDIGRMSNFVVTSALDNWVKQDSVAAIDWVRKNAEKFPNLITEGTKLGVLGATAANDPKRALKLISEFEITDASLALAQIANSARTPVERTATLTALRDYLAAMPDESARNEAVKASIGGFTHELVQDGFAAATQWIAGANLSPTELESIAERIIYSTESDEDGQWIDWIGEKIPAGKSEAPIHRIVGKWTRRDYQAAGKWLSTRPPSPAKNAAIRSYAEIVSTLDPATATQWAMTLPPGPDRDATLKHIQDHPPTK